MQNDNQGLVPGRKPVLEQLAAAADKVDTIFIQQGRARAGDHAASSTSAGTSGLRYRMLPRTELARICPGNTQGVVARIIQRGFVELDALLDEVADAPLPLLVALDQVQDPGNVGALARTLYAMAARASSCPRTARPTWGLRPTRPAPGRWPSCPWPRS